MCVLPRRQLRLSLDVLRNHRALRRESAKKISSTSRPSARTSRADLPQRVIAPLTNFTRAYYADATWSYSQFRDNQQQLPQRKPNDNRI